MGTYIGSSRGWRCTAEPLSKCQILLRWWVPTGDRCNDQRSVQAAAGPRTEPNQKQQSAAASSHVELDTFLGRVLAALFLICMCGLMLQIIETMVLSVIAYYYLAFFAIGMAMFGITARSLFCLEAAERRLRSKCRSDRGACHEESTSRVRQR